MLTATSVQRPPVNIDRPESGPTKISTKHTPE
jgi:hypothetical protein